MNKITNFTALLGNCPMDCRLQNMRRFSSHIHGLVSGFLILVFSNDNTTNPFSYHFLLHIYYNIFFLKNQERKITPDNLTYVITIGGKVIHLHIKALSTFVCSYSRFREPNLYILLLNALMLSSFPPRKSSLSYYLTYNICNLSIEGLLLGSHDLVNS